METQCFEKRSTLFLNLAFFPFLNREADSMPLVAGRLAEATSKIKTQNLTKLGQTVFNWKMITLLLMMELLIFIFLEVSIVWYTIREI